MMSASSSTNLTVLGMQWGDEGKGKIVDLLCPDFDLVVRYQGGNNAGHTVKFSDQHFALHLIPSGILHDDSRCVLGNGVVVDPDAFLAEVEGLRERGVEARGRLFISDRATVVLDLHRALDTAREAAASDKIGTTAKGIGPAYESRASRQGLAFWELWSAGVEDRLRALRDRAAWEIGEANVAPVEALMRAVDGWRESLSDYVTDATAMLHRAATDGSRILFEGAQGMLLDRELGTYPYVTSSSTSAGGVATGTGLPPRITGNVLGIVKAYTSRVGEGPFPTELDDGWGEHLRTRGNEVGTTTGRPRRCGWVDLVALRYAQGVNGCSAFALTKLDVLDELEEIPVCVAYEVNGVAVDTFPASIEDLAAARPVLENLPGWQTDTVGLTDYEGLPANARAYVEYLENALGAPAAIISTGPRREETIVRSDLL